MFCRIGTLVFVNKIGYPFSNTIFRLRVEEFSKHYAIDVNKEIKSYFIAVKFSCCSPG